MLKAILTSTAVAGLALLIATPAPTFAESPSRAGSHVKRHSAHRSKHYKHDPSHHRRHVRHHRRHVRHHRHDPSHHRHHRRHHWHHRRHHRHHRRHHRHHGVHIGINIGGLGYRPSYPHGHVHHVHDAYCPVVVRPVVVAPVWEVYYHSHHRHPSTAPFTHCRRGI